MRITRSTLTGKAAYGASTSADRAACQECSAEFSCREPSVIHDWRLRKH